MTTALEEFPRPSGIEPLSGEDRVLANASKAKVILFSLRTQADADGDAYETMQRKIDSLKRDDLAPLLRMERDLELAPQRHEDLIADNARKIARVKATIAATTQKHEDDKKRHGGTPCTTLDDFLRRQQVPLKDTNTQDTAIDGRTAAEMMELRRDEATKHQYQLEGLKTSDCTWPEIEKRIMSDVAKIASSPNVWPAKRFRPVGATGRTAQGHVEFPKISIESREYIDAVGLLLSVPAIQKQVVDHLLSLAKADYSDEFAMTPRQRAEAIEAAKAAHLLALRRAHFWHRQLADEGTRLPYPSANPWAILDVTE